MEPPVPARHSVPAGCCAKRRMESRQVPRRWSCPLRRLSHAAQPRRRRGRRPPIRRRRSGRLERAGARCEQSDRRDLERQLALRVPEDRLGGSPQRRRRTDGSTTSARSRSTSNSVMHPDAVAGREPDTRPPTDRAEEAAKEHPAAARLFQGACAGCHEPGSPMAIRGRPSLSSVSDLRADDPHDAIQALLPGPDAGVRRRADHAVLRRQSDGRASLGPLSL